MFFFFMCIYNHISMLFKKDLIEKILKGKKTVTSRSKPLYRVGDVTNLMANKDYSKATGKYIKITAVYDKALGKFTDEDSLLKAHSETQTAA